MKQKMRGWQWQQLHHTHLHLAPDRQSRQQLIMPNQHCQSSEGKSTEGKCFIMSTALTTKIMTIKKVCNIHKCTKKL